MKKTNHTNEHLKNLIVELKVHSEKENAPAWKAIAKELEKPTRRKRKVNLSKLNKVTNKDDLVVIPGKLLGDGELEHTLKIAAFQVSETAREKVKVMTIKEALKEDPKGKKLRIIC
jgi:large subunit ribosomal protein L18e